MNQPPPPPAAASAPPSGLCTSNWLEQVEPADPAAPGHAAAAAASAAEAADAAAARAPSSGWSGFLTNTAFDVLLERQFRTDKALSRRQEQLDEALQKLDASERRAAELERRVAELEAAAAAPAAPEAPAEPAAAAEELWDHVPRTMLSIVPSHDGGAFAEFGSTRGQIPVRWSSKRRIHQVHVLKFATSEGSALMFYYVGNQSGCVYARVKTSSGNIYSCRVEIRGDVLCCGVPIWSSNGDDTPAPIRWETIGRVEWVASPQSASAAAPSKEKKRNKQYAIMTHEGVPVRPKQRAIAEHEEEHEEDAASAAAPSELKKRSAPDAASALAVSKAKKKAKKRAKIPKLAVSKPKNYSLVLGPYLTAQEARVILQEYGPHGGRGGLYKIASGPNRRGDVFVNTETGVWIVIDWDLTIDGVSSPYNSNAHAIPDDAVRKQIFRENGYSDADYDNYMIKMHSILLVLAKLREQGYCDIVIVTRNDYRNVETFINTCATQAQSKLGRSRPSFSDEDFPIIAFPENGVPEDKKKNKAQLLAEHVPQIKSATRVVFVDDSHGKPTSEHERFAASARDVFSPEAMWRHVRVRRCPRYAVATKRGRKRTPYGGQGLGNQVDKLNEIAHAVMGSVHKDWTWNELAKDQLGLYELAGHEGVFCE